MLLWYREDLEEMQDGESASSHTADAPNFAAMCNVAYNEPKNCVPASDVDQALYSSVLGSVNS